MIVLPEAAGRMKIFCPWDATRLLSDCYFKNQISTMCPGSRCCVRGLLLHRKSFRGIGMKVVKPTMLLP